MLVKFGARELFKNPTFVTEHRLCLGSPVALHPPVGCLLLINPRPGGGLSHLRHGGGGGPK